MLRAVCLAMTMLVLPLESVSAEAPPDPGANAALKYWQAFSTLPRFTETEQKKLGESLTRPLDEHAQQLVTKAAYSLRMMHHGAALPRCDWGVGYEEEGLSVLCPHGEAARVLSSLACLRARLRFKEGKSAEALSDIVAAMTLARHVSRDGPFFMVLHGYAIEHRMIETLALHLPKLDAKRIKDLKRRLDALPLGGRPATGMKFEEEFALDWFVRYVKEAKDKDSLLALLTRALDTPEKGRAFLAECGGSAEGVLKFAEETRRSYARMAKKLDLPPDQVATEFEREEMKQAGNPVFKIIFPALVKVRLQQARIDVRRALLSAALAVQVGGRDALRNHPDPMVGGPFDYGAFEGGFELRSTWKLDDSFRSKWKLDERIVHPLTLTVGRRGN
jgi:hypothetical protein